MAIKIVLRTTSMSDQRRTITLAPIGNRSGAEGSKSKSAISDGGEQRCIHHRKKRMLLVPCDVLQILLNATSNNAWDRDLKRMMSSFLFLGFDEEVLVGDFSKNHIAVQSRKISSILFPYELTNSSA